MSEQSASSVRPRNDTNAGPADSVAFLVAKVGFHAAARYGQRLGALDLQPPHVGVLRAVAADKGQSQREIARRMHVPPSRMVSYIDDLEQRGLVERRPSPTDRRANALYLTTAGRRLLRQVVDLSIQHEHETCAGIDADQREQLIQLLRQLAANQDLPLDVHPGLVAGGPPL